MRDKILLRVMSLSLVMLLNFPVVAESKINCPDFDFSALDQFWLILSFLEKDLEPNQEMWDSLFSTPGYIALTKSEFTHGFFIKMFKLAYMPSKKDEATTFLIKAPAWQKAMLEHYHKIKADKLNIQAASNRFRARKNAIAAQSLQKALDFFPSTSAPKCPPVSFVVFANDARGYSPVVLDIVKAIESGDDLVYLLAHEFHHNLRNTILSFNPDLIKDEDKNIIWVLNQLQCEGIADLINIQSQLTDPVFRESEYYAFFKKSAAIIDELDDLFARISTFPKQIKEFGLELKNSIPWSGHPTGFYMAKTILDKKGKATLILDVGNPFRFIELYQDTALREGSGTPSFSPKAMELIRKLGSKYININ